MKKFYLHEIYENKVNLPLFGMEMYEQLKQSKIIFNIHTISQIIIVEI